MLFRVYYNILSYPWFGCVVVVKSRIVLAFPPGRNADEVSEGQFLLKFETDSPALCYKYRLLIRIDIVLSAREEISSSRLTPVKGANGQSDGGRNVGRSEEHTSELQSLMRTSYAVFCLKKKKTPHTHLTQHN